MEFSSIKNCRNPHCKHFKVAKFTGDIRRAICPICGSRLKQITKEALAEWIASGNDVMLDGAIFEHAYKKNPDTSSNGNGNGTALLPIHYQPTKLLPKPGDSDMTFTCDADVNGCPIPPNVSLYIPAEMWGKFRWLAMRNKVEWFAYLIGSSKLDDKGNKEWHITDFFFPPQKVTSAHCEPIHNPNIGKEHPGIVGTIHSHNTMEAFFSSEDKNHFNHPVEVVINAKGDFKTAIASTLKCGAPTRIEAELFLSAHDSYNLQASLEESIVAPEPTPINQQRFSPHQAWGGHFAID